MAAVSKTRNMIEGFVRDGSFKWLLKNRNPFHEEFEEMKMSPSGDKNWIYELSPVANIVVRRCSKILNIPTRLLQENFNEEAPDVTKDPSRCCQPAFHGYLIMQIDEDATVGIEAFSRIVPAVPIIADVIISDYIFEFLTASTGGRLQFSTFEKYLSGLERAVRKLKSQSESSLLSSQRSGRGERVLEVDGTVTTQPVLQHVGISTWPGRLTLTDHAMYFEALRVVSYDKPTVYELADDLKQFVKPELTGPWGTRLFDKAFLYKSVSLSDAIVMELPELKGHARRDYWLAIIREILYAHRFIRKFQITGVERDEILLKTIFGILRVQALKDISSAIPLSFEAGLMFNVCDQLPGGDRILETIATRSTTRELDRNSNTMSTSGMYSISASTMASSLGFVFGTSSNVPNKSGIIVGDVSVGELTPLEKAVKESRSNYKMVTNAQAAVDGVKVEGIDTNLAVMKELIFPVTELGNRLVKLFYWEEPVKSLAFCLVFTYVIYMGWFSYVLALLLAFLALFMMVTRCCSRGRPVDEFKVTAPPPMNTMEQLLAVQNAISQAEELIQDGNVVLLKLRGLLLSIFPQASDRFAVALGMSAVFVAFVPIRFVVLLVFLEEFTKYSPMRRSSTERWNRRLREWWFSIPAAPIVLEKLKEDKKKK
ncbi:uncharacterized protein LOC112525999 isoform X2 [Cynara cardunculus var. scolymus]|uniref:uncharacterized protein LOC112525999 isoform X2 n=1 Tax=Cynara cardunculus var. scolymus TaxID=59895 RepID=UPI000D631289|nr:uncharacterized protein LOC112525999 isoform X2 [Cynara cardunculus var. scolymus]